jgi:TetR/AcrR family transcriptional regulator
MTPEADTDTRERILDAARTAFRESGTSGARMQEIADAAGVNKALLHYYFRNKETLAAGVFTRELGRLVRPVFDTLGSEAPLDEKVRRVVGLYLDTLSEFPGLPAYVLAEIHFHPERMGDFLTQVAEGDPRDRAAQVFEVLDGQLESAAADGRIRPITAHEFVVNLVSLCVFPFAAAPLIRVLTGGQEPLDRMMGARRERLPEFFLAGLEGAS